MILTRADPLLYGVNNIRPFSSKKEKNVHSTEHHRNKSAKSIQSAELVLAKPAATAAYKVTIGHKM